MHHRVQDLCECSVASRSKSSYLWKISAVLPKFYTGKRVCSVAEGRDCVWQSDCRGGRAEQEKSASSFLKQTLLKKVI